MKYRYICARFQDLKEDLKNSISKFRRLPKLADKFNCSNQNRKSVAKGEFPFSLKPSDI